MPATNPALDLRCTVPGCRYYAAGTHPETGVKLCGRHMPELPVECPICEGSGEVAAQPIPRDPAALVLNPCWGCAGNGALTVVQHVALTDYLASL